MKKDKPLNVKELKIPMRFNVAMQKYEPDLEKLKDILKNGKRRQRKNPKSRKNH